MNLKKMNLKKINLKKILIETALSLILLILSVATIDTHSFATSVPTDITGHWSEPFVTSLVSQGVISGYPDGTFKPDKAISSSEFLSLILKAIGEKPTSPQTGESWDTPIIKLAIEKGIIKSDDEFAQSNQELTREETAYILYNTLSRKENFEYDQCYTPILDQVIFDHESISTKYRDSVYSMLQKGVFTVSQSYFTPQNSMTRGATCVVIERVMDKTKRLEPDSDLMKNDAIKTIKISTIEPKESTSVKYMSFENGKPVIDNEAVYNELRQHPNNAFTGALADYYDYEAYINSEWKSPYYQTYEKKKEAVDEYYDTAVNGLKVMYNYSYTDITTYEKNLKYYEVDNHSTEDWINRRLDWITDKTLVMESYFVTDKSLFYLGSDGRNRTRGRLYFIYHSPSQEANMSDVDLKVDQWYCIDFEVKTSQYLGQFGVEWEHARITLGGKIYLSDVIPLEPLN